MVKASMTDRSDQQGRYAEDRGTKDHFTVHNPALLSLKWNDAPAAILSPLKRSQLNSQSAQEEEPPSTGVSCLIPTPQRVKIYLACSFLCIYMYEFTYEMIDLGLCLGTALSWPSPCPPDTCINICILMFIGALFTVVTDGNNLGDHWQGNGQNAVCTFNGTYSALEKGKEIMMHATT